MNATADSKVQRLIRWREGEIPGPWLVRVYPTNRCNLRCKICWLRRMEEEGIKLDHSLELSDERMLRLVDEGAELGVREWLFIGGGEPMLRGDLLMEMASRIRAHGMNGGLVSNGTKFNEENIRQFVEMGWEHINVSIDAPTLEVNDTIRSKGAFEKATRSIRLLVEGKRAAGVSKPEIAISSVITNRNYHQVEDMVRLAAELEIDGMLLLHALHDHCDSTSLFQLDATQKDDMWKHMRAAETLSHQLGVRTNILDFTPATGVKMPAKSALHRKSAGRDMIDSACFETRYSITILGNGAVGGCCTFDDNGEACQNLHDMTLEEAWTGSYLTDLRARLVDGNDLPAYCALCPSHVGPCTKALRTQMKRSMWRELAVPELAQLVAEGVRNSFDRRGIVGTAKRALEVAAARARL